MNYMSYGYPTPNQSGNSTISPMSTSKGGSCCGSKAPISPTPTPYPAQQSMQSMPMQSMSMQSMPMQNMSMQSMPMQNMPMQSMPMQQSIQQPFANQPMPMQQPMSMQQPMAMQQPVATQQAATMPPSVASGNVITPSGTVLTGLPQEQSFIENILRLNLGKVGTFYMTYENNSEWNAKIFRGKIEAAGRDHLIISDPRTGQRIMLLMVNFDYATFDEPLNYEYPFRQPVSSEEQ